MKPKSKPGSKIPTTQTNTNKKKSADLEQNPKGFDASLIKKNEFALILFGALFLTVIVFFLFFRSSSSKTVEMQVPGSSSYIALEKRIQSLETSLKDNGAPVNASDAGKELAKVDLLAQRVARLETAFSVKFESVIDRMAGMENSISQLKKTKEIVAAKAASKPVAVKKAVAAKKPIQKVSAPVVKKAVKKTNLFHTVQKGETLYSISRKYKTTVDAIRKLNNLSETAKIYPGNNILIR